MIECKCPFLDEWKIKWEHCSNYLHEIIKEKEKLEIQLADTQAELIKHINPWISVTEDLPDIAAPYIQEGDWVLIDDEVNPIEIACRVWITEEDDPELSKWVTTSGEERFPVRWMRLPKVENSKTK